MRNLLLSCLLLVVVSLRPQPVLAQTLEVAAELQRINDAHKEAILKASGDAALRAAADSSRDTALRDLVERASAAKSQEHGPLAEAYARLKRMEDAQREAHAAVAEHPDDHASHTLLVGLLCFAGKPDEAERAFADACAGLVADPRYLAMPHNSLFRTYERAGRDADAVRVTVLYLDALWASLAKKPDEVTPFIEGALYPLAILGERTKSAEKPLPVFEQVEKRLAAATVPAANSAKLASTLRSVKIRVLMAAGEQDAARKLALEDVALAEKQLAADPKSLAAVIGVIKAREQMFLRIDQGRDAEEYLRAHMAFFETHVNDHKESEEFLIRAGNSLHFAVRELGKVGKFEAAEAWLQEWETRLKGLDVQTPAAKNYANGLSNRFERRLLNDQRKNQQPPKP